jgi:hypothetical protein
MCYIYEYRGMMPRYDAVRLEAIPNHCHHLIEMRVMEMPLVGRHFRVGQLLRHGFADIGIPEIVEGIQTPINSSVGAIGQGIRARGPETIRDRASRV